MKNKQTHLNKWFRCNGLIVDFSKLISVTIIIMFFIFSMMGDFSRVLQITMSSVMLYFIFTITYFAFSTNKKDIAFLLNSWKIYFPVVFILGSIQFSTLENLSSKVTAFYKTTLDYHISTNASNEIVKKSYDEYKDSVESYLSQYEFTSLNTILKDSIKKEQVANNSKKSKVSIYLNFAPTIILVITLIMFLWSFKSLSLFKCKKVYRQKPKITYKKIDTRTKIRAKRI